MVEADADAAGEQRGVLPVAVAVLARNVRAVRLEWAGRQCAGVTALGGGD